MDVKLNFINHSNDANNSQIVIFQKNVAADFDDHVVAWKVIQNCGQGENHPFVYPMTTQVAASDNWGNYTPRLTAEPGQLFSMRLTASGDHLAPAGAGASTREIQLSNELAKGAINANIFKAGKLLAIKTSIAPGQKAVFEFKPTLFIGVVSEVEEGSVLNAAILSSVNTELSLLGIASADIVMTGGGPGADSTPLQFNIENMVRA